MVKHSFLLFRKSRLLALLLPGLPSGHSRLDDPGCQMLSCSEGRQFGRLLILVKSGRVRASGHDGRSPGQTPLRAYLQLAGKGAAGLARAYQLALGEKAAPAVRLKLF